MLYANEVRSLTDLDIENVQPTPAELKRALQFIDQISEDTYNPTMFEDEEKKRILAAIDAKIAGKEVVASPHAGEEAGAQVIDLTQALMASLKGPAATAKAPTAAKPAPAKAGDNVAEMGAKRKGVRRAAKTVEPAAEPARTRVPGSAFAPDKRD